MKEEFTFSSDTGEITNADLRKSAAMTEKIFNNENDPSQMPSNPANGRWIRKNIPHYLNIIKKGNELVGYFFVVPTTRKIMYDFLVGKITERQLINKVKKEKKHTGTALYLCAAVLKPKYQRQGLALTAALKIIIPLRKQKPKPVLFMWAYSEAGEKLAEKVAQKTKLMLLKKK